MSGPLVSICIPVYNMASTLEASIRSVLRQSYADWELVIVDNASTDESNDIAERFSRLDSRISVVRIPATVPMVDNYNNCIRNAKGELLNILSADDLLAPEFVSSCTAVFRENRSLGYVATGHSLIDEHDHVTSRSTFYRESGIIPGLSEAMVNLAGNHSAPSYMMYNKDALAAAGGFLKQFPYCFDIYTKLRLNLFCDVGYIARNLCSYRVTSEQGPSLYRKSDLSPLFELYQIKVKILSEMALDENARAEMMGRISLNLGRVSVSLARFALTVKGDDELARQLMLFAFGFSPRIVEVAHCRDLLKELNIHADLYKGMKAGGDMAGLGAPYDLPPGSSPLDPRLFLEG